VESLLSGKVGDTTLGSCAPPCPAVVDESNLVDAIEHTAGWRC
jgi:hypothetical protein